MGSRARGPGGAPQQLHRQPAHKGTHQSQQSHWDAEGLCHPSRPPACWPHQAQPWQTLRLPFAWGLGISCWGKAKATLLCRDEGPPAAGTLPVARCQWHCQWRRLISLMRLGWRLHPFPLPLLSLCSFHSLSHPFSVYIAHLRIWRPEKVTAAFSTSNGLCDCSGLR